MWLNAFLLAVVLATNASAFAVTQTGAQAEPALAGIEWRNIEKMLAKHFSQADIESLKEYMKGAMYGLANANGTRSQGEGSRFYVGDALGTWISICCVDGRVEKESVSRLAARFSGAG